MKIIKSAQGTKKTNSPNCTITEYGMGSDLDMAVAHISGREPLEGFAMNSISREIAYVIEGHGTVVIKNETKEIGPGDIVIIEKNEPFYWEGNFKLLLVCTPAWNTEQYQTNVTP